MPYGATLRALAQLPTYDPRALNTTGNLGQDEPADPMYGGMYGPSPMMMQMQSPEVPPPPADPGVNPQAGMNPNMAVGFDQPMNAGQERSPQDQPQVSPEILEQLRALTQTGPAQQRYMEALTGQPAPVHGFGGHLMGALKGLAMGNIGGAIMGAVDPNMVERAWHRVQSQAYQQPAQVEQQMQEQRLKQAAMIANSTGIEPTTGLRTPASEYKDFMAQVAAGNLANRQRSTDSLIDRRSASTVNQERTSRSNQLGRQLSALQIGNKPLSPADLERLRTEYPDYVFPSGFDPSKYTLQINGAGQVQAMPTSGGEAKAVTQDGKPVASFQGTQLKSREAEGAANRDVRVSEGEKTRQAQAQRQSQAEAHSTAQKTVDSAKKTLDAAQVAFNKAEAMFGASDAQRQAVETARKAYDAALATAAQTVKPQAQGSTGAVRDPMIGRTVNGGRNTIVGVKNGQYVFEPPLQ